MSIVNRPDLIFAHKGDKFHKIIYNVNYQKLNTNIILHLIIIFKILFIMTNSNLKIFSNEVKKQLPPFFQEVVNTANSLHRPR